MKKILFVALAAAAMVGCSQNEEIENAGQKVAVNFGTAVSSTTKAVITNDAALQTSGFTVYAYNTGTNLAGSTNATLGTEFMPATSVTYKNKTWGFDGEYYWPLTDNIQFFAYATDAAANNYVASEATKYPSIDYTVAGTAAGQKDFVVASALNKTKTANAVQLTFGHALTQVNFSAIGSAGFTYKITSVGLEGVFGAGTYTFDGTWKTTGTTTTYAYPIVSGGASIDGATLANLDQADGALMLIPQVMTADSKIAISYEVYKNSVKIDQADAKISLNTTAEWEAGKKVRYTLTLTAAGATVSFAPEVGPWSVGDDTPVPVQ